MQNIQYLMSSCEYDECDESEAEPPWPLVDSMKYASDYKLKATITVTWGLTKDVAEIRGGKKRTRRFLFLFLWLLIPMFAASLCGVRMFALWLCGLSAVLGLPLTGPGHATAG